MLYIATDGGGGDFIYPDLSQKGYVGYDSYDYPYLTTIATYNEFRTSSRPVLFRLTVNF